MYEYNARMVRVVDADTFDADIELGFYVTTRQRLRLLGSLGGVDAYEINSSDAVLKAFALAGKARVMNLLPVGAPFVVKTTKKDSFGRFLAEVFLPTGQNLGDLLLNEGLAIPYKG